MTTTVRSASLNGGRATASGKSFLKLVLMVIVLLVVAKPADCQDQGSKAPEQPKKIKAVDLRPGDVLLYRFGNIVGKLILLFQGGDYNHASIYDGKQVLEATDQGIIRDDLRSSVKNAEYVDIYRLCEG